MKRKKIIGYLPFNVMVVACICCTGMLTAQTKPPNPLPSAGLIGRLLEIKYTTELFLSSELKKGSEPNKMNESKDSALGIYNTLRWKIDALVYTLSADMIARNSPRVMRLLNEWCVQQPEHLYDKEGLAVHPKSKIQLYSNMLSEINTLYHTHVLVNNYSHPKTLNLTTNVFYLLKDSYTIVKGLNDMKTQKTMALIELLDHTRLLSPGELLKGGK
jgi:hypothetical protein